MAVCVRSGIFCKSLVDNPVVSNHNIHSQQKHTQHYKTQFQYTEVGIDKFQFTTQQQNRA